MMIVYFFFFDKVAQRYGFLSNLATFSPTILCYHHKSNMHRKVKYSTS